MMQALAEASKVHPQARDSLSGKRRGLRGKRIKKWKFKQGRFIMSN